MLTTGSIQRVGSVYLSEAHKIVPSYCWESWFPMFSYVMFSSFLLTCHGVFLGLINFECTFRITRKWNLELNSLFDFTFILKVDTIKLLFIRVQSFGQFSNLSSVVNLVLFWHFTSLQTIQSLKRLFCVRPLNLSTDFSRLDTILSRRLLTVLDFT